VAVEVGRELRGDEEALPVGCFDVKKLESVVCFRGVLELTIVFRAVVVLAVLSMLGAAVLGRRLG
jgi:hypothetical protein